MGSLFVLDLPMDCDGSKYICPHIPLPFTGRAGVFRRVLLPAPGRGQFVHPFRKKAANRGLSSFWQDSGKREGDIHTAEPCRILPKKTGRETNPKNTWQGPDGRLSEDCGQNDCISGRKVTFTVDASELAGQTLVAFEKFTNEGREIFVHEDLEDLLQTIKIPKIGTTAKAGELDETAFYNEDGTPKEITITDTVSYENLWTKGLLGKLQEEGLTITDNGNVIASDHAPVYDINETGEYTMTGKLMDKATGKALTDVNGNDYETSVHFVPDAGNGTVDLTFTMNVADFIDKDGRCILDSKSIIVFEDLYQVPEDGETSEDNHTAVHHDIDDDQGQDVMAHHDITEKPQTDYIPSIHTNATDSVTGNHNGVVDGKDYIIDEVSYEKLQKGTT